MPYDLIERVVKLRVMQDQAKASAWKQARQSPV
jgi:hypothetical protein